MTGQYLLIILLISSWTCSKKSSGGNNPPPVNNDSTFTNPLLASGPDPWVIQKDTNYYYTNTFGNRIAIYKTSKMSELSKAAPVTVWSHPTGTAYSKDIWAPELNYIQNKWYIYFAADDGSNATHRIYVLENTNADPLTSSWTLKGKMSDTADKWSIDATVFEYNAQLYAAWRGWQGNVDGQP